MLMYRLQEAGREGCSRSQVSQGTSSHIHTYLNFLAEARRQAEEAADDLHTERAQHRIEASAAEGRLRELQGQMVQQRSRHAEFVQVDMRL